MAAHVTTRRGFVQTAGAFALAAACGKRLLAGESTVTLPFGNGERELIAYPQKRPLLRLTARPPQLETPFAVYNEGLITPNDAFFVRYHLSGIPTSIDPATFRLKVKGAVDRPLELSLAELKRLGEPQEIVAVNQCSGNSRGFFSPRVPGGQLANGAMGNAKWTGIALRTVLAKAGLKPGAVQVSFEGLDRPLLPATPEFVKALDLDHANDGEVMLAYAMNGEDLPMLNGYPLRLIVPGYFGTYWVKHVSDITVWDRTFTGFWMATAYRIPDNPTHSVPPGTVPAKTVPIGRMGVRSFVTNLVSGQNLPAGQATALRGIAFDGGAGIGAVRISTDRGRSWQAAALGRDLGKYSFREWTASIKAPRGPGEIWTRAETRAGEVQPLEPRWNPAGYMRNVVEKLPFVAAVLLLGLVFAVRSSAVEISLPAETAVLKPSDQPGYRLAVGYCAMCHSVDYIRTQPPAMPTAAWKAEVTKMRKVYGAPIPEENTAAIVAYLAGAYGSGVPAAPNASPAK